MQTIFSRNPGIRFILIAVVGVFALTALLAEAQIADRPLPGPEHKKLDTWVGEWEYEGSLKDTSLGPGGRFSGKESIRAILDGLFLETRGRDKGTYGGKEIIYQGVVIRWYDPIAGNYKRQFYDNDGFVGSGVEIVNGNTWTSTGVANDGKGRKNLTRTTTVFSPDGKSRITKADVSFDDGKTWAPFWELTATRVSP